MLANGQADATPAARLPAQELLAPARRPVAPGDLHSEDLAATFPIHSDGHEYGPSADHPFFAHLLLAVVADQVGELEFRCARAKFSSSPSSFTSLLRLRNFADEARAPATVGPTCSVSSAEFLPVD